MGLCLDATPGAFIHDPSAEKVLQPLIQAGSHPILLTSPSHWHLLGGTSWRISHLDLEVLPAAPIHSGSLPLDLALPLLGPMEIETSVHLGIS